MARNLKGCGKEPLGCGKEPRGMARNLRGMARNPRGMAKEKWHLGRCFQRTVGAKRLLQCSVTRRLREGDGPGDNQVGAPRLCPQDRTPRQPRASAPSAGHCWKHLLASRLWALLTTRRRGWQEKPGCRTAGALGGVRRGHGVHPLKKCWTTWQRWQPGEGEGRCTPGGREVDTKLGGPGWTSEMMDPSGGSCKVGGLAGGVGDAGDSGEAWTWGAL